jgi:hypothetical protein
MSPAYAPSRNILASSLSGAISEGLNHSIFGISTAYSGGLVGSLYKELSVGGNSESPKRASFWVQIYSIFLILSIIESSSGCYDCI